MAPNHRGMFVHLKRWWTRKRRRSMQPAPEGAPQDAGAEGEAPAPLPANRHGIRQIPPGADLAAMMGAPEAPEAGEDPSPGAPPGDSPSKRPRRRGRAPSTNRHGIRRIPPGASLERLMALEDRPRDDAAPPGGPPRSGSPRPEDPASPTAGGHGAESGEDFARLLEEALTGETAESMLRKKKEGAPRPRPLSPARRLERYPSPQDQLDLHGHRSHEAVRRTRAFVRSRSHRGLWTLRIIVGKGLHSENGPVLPDVVENTLSALQREGVVLAFRWEGRSKRRSGSVIVYLDGRRPRV